MKQMIFLIHWKIFILKNIIKKMLINKTKKNNNKSIYFSIADFNFKLDYSYIDENFVAGFKKIYKNFLIKDKPKNIDYHFLLEKKNNIQLLEKKEEKTFFINFFKIAKKKIVINSMIDPLLTQIIFRYVLLELLSIKNGFILHSSGSIVDDKVVLFTGKSNAGKSMVINLLDDEYKPFADDMVCIRRIENDFYCYSTPFYEKYSPQEIINQKPRLIKAIFLLERYNDNKILKVNKNKIVKKLISQLCSEKEYLLNQTKNMLNFIKLFNKFYIFKIGKINKVKKTFDDYISKISLFYIFLLFIKVF